MKNKYIKLLFALLAAVMCLCSCDAVKKAAGDAISSAKNEISSAIVEQVSEFKEGEAGFTEVRSEITSALNEVSDAIKSAGAEVPDELGSVSKELSPEISGAVNAVSEALSSAGAEISDELGSVSKELSPEISDAVNAVSEAISSAGAEVSDAVGKTTTAAETTAPAGPVDPDKSYTFRNQKRYDEHFEKHGAEFGSITKKQYLELANELIKSTSDRVLHKYSDDGDYMFFDQDKGYFLVLSEDGYIRTFFIPSAGIKYWNRQ